MPLKHKPIARLKAEHKEMLALLKEGLEIGDFNELMFEIEAIVKKIEPSYSPLEERD